MGWERRIRRVTCYPAYSGKWPNVRTMCTSWSGRCGTMWMRTGPSTPSKTELRWSVASLRTWHLLAVTRARRAAAILLHPPTLRLPPRSSAASSGTGSGTGTRCWRRRPPARRSVWARTSARGRTIGQRSRPCFQVLLIPHPVAFLTSPWTQRIPGSIWLHSLVNLVTTTLLQTGRSSRTGRLPQRRAWARVRFGGRRRGRVAALINKGRWEVWLPSLKTPTKTSYSKLNCCSRFIMKSCRVKPCVRPQLLGFLEIFQVLFTWLP